MEEKERTGGRRMTKKFSNTARFGASKENMTSHPDKTHTDVALHSKNRNIKKIEQNFLSGSAEIIQHAM